ncbi:indole-3-glycerol phosphate synthase TrpC [Melioribacteraceae bacterium 4301-Me]|uniref:indole-3-glycerol phosphate synthase TrpC n=1 Tax=Pyranulibacter aquaticus TaxID=3163344 RepID=UPI00359ACCE7
MNILEKILETKKIEVSELHRKFSRSSFTNFELFNKKSLDFKSALSKNGKINLIAEIKKASPSKGILKENFDYLEIARKYMSNGVDAISILTDQRYFFGNISFLKSIAEIKTVPLLRKDFIIDEFQILEAKANGADAILLIAEALSKAQIDELTNTAYENDLEALLEIHSEDQLKKIDFDKNKIIGINNRDLRTFQVSLTTTSEIVKKIPNKCLIISESGINSKDDVNFLKNTRVNALLVGEYFMKSENIDESLKQFIDWCKK